MSLRERVQTWLQSQVKQPTPTLPMVRGSTDAVGFVPSAGAFFGPGIGNQPTHSDLLRENLGVADFATRAIADRLSALNPQVKVRRREARGTMTEEILDDHRLKALLDNPHPDFSRAQILRLTGQYMATVGEAYWVKVGNGLGVPIQIDPFPPDRVTPIVIQNVIEGYRVVDADGDERMIEADAIVRFWFPDPENPFGSEGYLGPNGTVTDAMRFQHEHLRKTYQDHAIPPAFIKAEKEAPKPSPEAKEAWEEEWNQKHNRRFGRRGMHPGWLPPGFDIVFSTLQTGGDITPLLDYMTRMQLMNFRVPRALLGEVVSGDRSSAEALQWIFDTYAMMPLTTLIENTLTRKLAADFDPSLLICFEPYASSDKDWELKKEQQDLTLKVRSVNEVREERGWDPVPWGELPVGAFSDTPYTGEEPELPSVGEGDDENGPPVDAEGEETDEEEGEESDEEDEPRGQRSFEEEAWARAVLYERRFGGEMMMRLRMIFLKQKRRAVERIRRSNPRSRITVSEFFSPREWVNEFERQVTPLYRLIIARAGQDAIQAVGLSATFLQGPTTERIVQTEADRLVERTSRTTSRRLKRAVSAAIANGESVDQIVDRVGDVFDNRRKRDARLIARTEVLKSHQTATVEAYRQTAGIVQKKQWNTALDGRVRDNHIALEGVQVGVAETFNVGGTSANSPGDPVLPLRETTNCRCFLSPVLGAE